LASAYDRLGLEVLRDDAQRVLSKNFPDSKFPAEGLTARAKAWWQLW
jgi:outer membrane protein assembly factor BamD